MPTPHLIDEKIELTERNWRDHLLMTLSTLKVHKAIIEFEGSGDDGSITDVTLMDRDGAVLKKVEKVNIHSVTDLGVEATTLDKSLMDFCYAELEKTQLDWWNNDGGYGEMVIMPSAECPIRLDVYIRETRVDEHEFII